MSFEQFRKRCEEITENWAISGTGYYVKKANRFYAIFPGNLRFVCRSWFPGISMYKGKTLLTHF